MYACHVMDLLPQVYNCQQDQDMYTYHGNYAWSICFRKYWWITTEYDFYPFLTYLQFLTMSFSYILHPALFKSLFFLLHCQLPHIINMLNFKDYKFKGTWWSGPLLCMACMSPIFCNLSISLFQWTWHEGNILTMAS